MRLKTSLTMIIKYIDLDSIAHGATRWIGEKVVLYVKVRPRVLGTEGPSVLSSPVWCETSQVSFEVSMRLIGDVTSLLNIKMPHPWGTKTELILSDIFV